MIRRTTFEQVGLLDDRYFLYFEEIDYCKTVHDAGWEVTFYPDIRFVHLGGQSSDKTQASTKGRQMVSIRLKSEYRYFRKYGGLFVVLATAALEYAWNLLVWAKNALSDSPNSALKRKARAWLKEIEQRERMEQEMKRMEAEAERQAEIDAKKAAQEAKQKAEEETERKAEEARQAEIERKAQEAAKDEPGGP